jgi:hypothetical protein
LLRGFRESPASEWNPNQLSRLFDEFSSSSGATASKTAACLPVLVCSQPKCRPQCSSPVKQSSFRSCYRDARHPGCFLHGKLSQLKLNSLSNARS